MKLLDTDSRVTLRKLWLLVERSKSSQTGARTGPSGGRVVSAVSAWPSTKEPVVARTASRDRLRIDLDKITAVAKPSYSFTLAGRSWSCRQAYDFPYGVMETLMLASDRKEKIPLQIAACFEAALMPDDIMPFMEILSQTHPDVTIPKLQPLVTKIVKEVFERTDLGLLRSPGLAKRDGTSPRV